MSEIIELSAIELSSKIRRKELSPKEVIDAILTRIDDCSNLNAFVMVAADEARQAAAEAEQAVMQGRYLGPLHGIPYSVKDVANCRGIKTSYGSKALPGFMPEADSLAVSRIRAAGGVLLGKTTTPELAHKIHTSSPLFGLTLNPYNPDVTCGGSSGGAAVAVAAGMGPIALGTDGGGSVRIPAACCGVVGLKPTIGRISDPQAQDLFGVSSHVGPIARNVADTRLFFDVIQGGHFHDPYSLAGKPASKACTTLEGVRVGWMPRCGNKHLDKDVEHLTRHAVKRMESMGAIVEEIEIDFAGLEPYFFVLMETRIAKILHAYPASMHDQLDPTLIPHYNNGLKHSSLDYLDALTERANAFRKVQDILNSHDVIVSPTLAAPPLSHTQDPHGTVAINGIETGRVRAAWYPYTLGFNMTGHPAISIPCGYTPDGLPVGFQLAGCWFDEPYLLDMAELLEKNLAVSKKNPLNLRPEANRNADR